MKRAAAMLLSIIMLVSLFAVNAFATATVTSDYVYLWPVPSSTFITSYCGVDGHLGIDITTVTSDTKVVAARGGIVLEVHSTDCTHINNYGADSCNGGRGNYITIKHDDGSTANYYHFLYDSLKVSAGDTVTAGQELGIMGSSGNSTGTHLHFQLNDSNGNLINNSPDSIDYAFTTSYLNAEASYELWKVGATYNIRDIPSTSGRKLGSLANRSFVAITEWREAEGYTWGRILFTAPSSDDFKDCWVALTDETKIKDVTLNGAQPSIDTDSEADTDITEVGQRWQIDDNTHLHIRNGAGISFTHMGWLEGGEIVEISKTCSADGYLWGEIISVNGDTAMKGYWCSLDFATELTNESKGDINNDGKVDIVDIANLRGYIVKNRTFNSEEISRADLNNDNVANIIDLTRMRRMIVEKK